MKKLLLAITLLLSFSSLFATHFAGGEIWYEYAGTAQHPHRYDVYAIIYRDISGTSMCPGYCPANICVTSSCFPSMTVTAPLEPFIIKPGSDTALGTYPGSIRVSGANQCVNSNSQNLVITEIYRFHAQVDLPGTCSDFTFTYSESARNSSSNLIGQDYFHIKAELNNTQGNNTSSRFLSYGSRSFCAGIPAIWQQRAEEPDGDSLYYELGQPLGGTCGNPTQLPYAAGYSQNNPITTVSGVTLNHQTGVLSFTPAQIEVVVVNLQVSEYRYNTTSNSWYLIGHNTRDVQIPIVSNSDCKAPPQDWFQMTDSTSNNFTSILKCNDSIIELAFEENIITSSIAADATDFALLNSQGLVLPIVAITYPTNVLETRKVKLHLHQPIEYNDTLALVIRVGSDGNTLQTICSNSIPKGDSLMLYVKDCATSISLAEIDASPFNAYPNPAKDALHISSNTDVQQLDCEVLDFSGKVLLNQKLQNTSESLNIQSLPTGFYLLRINTNKGEAIIKFEKKL